MFALMMKSTGWHRSAGTRDRDPARGRRKDTSVARTRIIIFARVAIKRVSLFNRLIIEHLTNVRLTCIKQNRIKR